MKSAKTYKQWCKARGIDFVSYIRKFPRVACRLALTLPGVTYIEPIKKLTLWEKVKAFFKY
jgi:hypothetical protein